MRKEMQNAEVGKQHRRRKKGEGHNKGSRRRIALDAAAAAADHEEAKVLWVHEVITTLLKHVADGVCEKEMALA